MQICVGATSRRVVEEAAKLNVAQIIASRGQVDVGGGYTGMDQADLVATVRRFSSGTKIVRDHGGPLHPDDNTYMHSFAADVDAGFDVLHVDVTHYPYHDRPIMLRGMLDALDDADVEFDIGGEHDENDQNAELFELAQRIAGDRVRTLVFNAGGLVHADRQCGYLITPEMLDALVGSNRYGIDLKLHNMDWVGQRHEFDDVVDYCNIAPEIGCVETDAILPFIHPRMAKLWLMDAYASGRWMRWFNDGERSWMDRAKCAFRYTHTPAIELEQEEDEWVREAISDAIRNA